MVGEFKKNLGFGCMRLPMIGDDVDIEQTKQMVDSFFEMGFNYFDTAHGYIGGKSETALKAALTSRYPREKYILTDKLSENYFEKREEIRPYVQQMLDACGVTYFDYLLMHAQNHGNYPKYQRCQAYEECFQLKKEGIIRHLGISFHDSAAVLEQILKDHPEIEVVQLQINYLDWEDAGVQSRKCYEMCEKYGKQVIVMEPVKGGKLANVPEEGKKIFASLGRLSDASYAIRFAASHPNVMMVLSGMSSQPQMLDNVSYMQEFKPLSKEEEAAVWQVRDIFNKQNTIPCTNCRYCVDVCPQSIRIPDLFANLNDKIMQKPIDTREVYKQITADSGKASDCVRCGGCEHMCPQHLEIRNLLERVAKNYG